MTTAIVLSVLFLLSYVTYHAASESTKFGGEGAIKSIYYFILLSHILLAIVIVPLVLISYVRALSEKFDKHRKIARYTLPLWLYVTITGVIVYLMISPYYLH
jgi:putative membrane protein